MAGLTEFYCRLNETSHASQFKWLEYTFNTYCGYAFSPIATYGQICFIFLINILSGQNSLPAGLLELSL
jgi:hypothetical protein